MTGFCGINDEFIPLFAIPSGVTKSSLLRRVVCDVRPTIRVNCNALKATTRVIDCRLVPVILSLFSEGVLESSCCEIRVDEMDVSHPVYCQGTERASLFPAATIDHFDPPICVRLTVRFEIKKEEAHQQNWIKTA